MRACGEAVREELDDLEVFRAAVGGAGGVELDCEEARA
jgi:hypothetical protein